MPRRGEQVGDHEAMRAINAARYAQPRGGSRTGRKPMAFAHYVYRDSLVVKPYRPQKLYANHEGHHLARYSHLARFGWKAYDSKTGKLRLTCIRYLCGGSSTHVRMEDEPTLPVCAKCRIALVGFEEATRALDAMYNVESV